MEVLYTADDMRKAVRARREQGLRIGLVPTMGCLHEGHLSLIRLAREHCGAVVVSLFVNPTQFGPQEDYETYPRDAARDEALCREEGAAMLFCPSVRTMYAEHAGVYVAEKRLSKGLCGRSRPGHFRGVLTVVAKLFNLVQPDVAVFGRKDAQQLRLIECMARDLFFPIHIVGAPIVREPDGLAMSSRNACLSAAERKEALCLYRALQAAETAFAGGERHAAALQRIMLDVASAAPSAVVDYAEVVDRETLEPVTVLQAPALAALAVRIGRTRLIDNTLLEA